MSRLVRWCSAHRRVAFPTAGRGAVVPLNSEFRLVFSGNSPNFSSQYERPWSGSRFYSILPESYFSSRNIVTLHPEKLRSAGQQILTLSGQRTFTLRANLPDSLNSPANPRMQAIYKPRCPNPFPPHTHGVFYYHSTSAEIRFRLCKTVEEFDGGSDLKLPDSCFWHLSLATMVKNPSTYGPLLALVEAEFPVAPQPQAFNPNRYNHRLISTFSPQRLLTMNQQILDISGLPRMHIRPRGRDGSLICYTASHSQGVWQHLPFPNNTTGVFYYRQSHTSPKRVGELRFRLCSDLQAFDAGSDLLLPSGEPWFISSQSLHITHRLKSVRERLDEEGLLEHDLYPGVPDSMLSLGRVPLFSLGQPFVVDLSATNLSLQIINPKPQGTSADVNIFFVFRKHRLNKPLFSGRAVVCLEQYPTLDPLNRKNRRAVIALRVLELLTPMQRLSSDNDILKPTPGQLLVHRYRHTSEYVPWGYSPSNPDTRAVITDWIHAQSISSGSD